MVVKTEPTADPEVVVETEQGKPDRKSNETNRARCETDRAKYKIDI